MTVVLDTSAVIAFFRDESGATKVAATLDDAVIIAPIASEIVAVLIRYGSDYATAVSALQKLGVRILPMSEALALETGLLVAKTRELGLSLADCACIALAIEMGAEVLSADRQWAKTGLPARVHIIR